MAIHAITGRKGSGKSILVTLFALEALDANVDCYSNYGVKDSYYLPFELFPGVKDARVCIDEAGDWFSAKDWNNFTSGQRFIIRQERKVLGDEKRGAVAGIFYGSPAFNDVVKELRLMTDYVWVCRCFFYSEFITKSLGIPCGIFRAKQFFPYEIDMENGRAKQKARARRTKWYRLNRRLMGAYDTYTIINKDESIEHMQQRLLAERKKIEFGGHIPGRQTDVRSVEDDLPRGALRALTDLLKRALRVPSKRSQLCCDRLEGAESELLNPAEGNDKQDTPHAL